MAVPNGANAGPFDDDLAAARQDVEAGRCEQAYHRLAAIEGLESRARLLSGQCRIRAALYPEALSDLDPIRGDSGLSQEQVGDVELYRGVALYHLERYAEAAEALEAADGLTREAAQFSLYRGLLALRDGNNDRAAPALESAARLSPQLTEPVASYYAGLAWQGVSERSKARDAFNRVIALDPDSAWAKEAAVLLESTELFPFYVKGSFGVEYDDNVILRGGVTQSVSADDDNTVLTFAGEKDWRAVWEIDGGVQLFSDEDWSGGINASYYGNAHFDLADLNLQYPQIGAYLARRIGPQTVAQARYQFGHAWLDENPFLQSHVGEVSLAHNWQEAGSTIVLGEILWNDVRFNDANVQDGSGVIGSACADVTESCGPLGLNERNERDRDGLGLGAAVQHSFLVPIPANVSNVFEEVELAGSYRFRWYDAQGDEWTHFAHTFSAGIEVDLPFDFSVGTRASYQFREFDNPSTFPDQEIIGLEYGLAGDDREEHEMNFEAEVEKGLTDNLSVSARYAYQEIESNRRVFDLTRHVVGAYLNFRFD